jgi:G3E family GTPase
LETQKPNKEEKQKKTKKQVCEGAKKCTPRTVRWWKSTHQLIWEETRAKEKTRGKKSKRDWLFMHTSQEKTEKRRKAYGWTASPQRRNKINFASENRAPIISRFTCETRQ